MLDVAEPFLLDPGPSVLLDGGCPVVSIQTRDLGALVQSFFSLGVHSSCLRALLGRPLTAKLRKDLDDVAEASGVRVREAWRAFDVLRAVFNRVEELDVDATPITPFLEACFRLDRSLAWKLMCALAIMRWRLNVASDSARRRCAGWRAEVLIECVSAMLCGWSAAGGAAPPGCPGWQLCPAAAAPPRPALGLSLDPALLLALRELTARLLRTRSDRADAAALIVPAFATAMGEVGNGSDAAATAAARRALPKLLGGLASLAQRLSTAEYRDFFDDVAGGVLEPLAEGGALADPRARRAMLLVAVAGVVPAVAAGGPGAAQTTTAPLLPTATRDAWDSAWRRFVGVVAAVVDRVQRG